MRVLVLRSAARDFFLAHYDVAAIGTNVGGPEPERKKLWTQCQKDALASRARRKPQDASDVSNATMTETKI